MSFPFFWMAPFLWCEKVRCHVLICDQNLCSLFLFLIYHSNEKKKEVFEGVFIDELSSCISFCFVSYFLLSFCLLDLCVFLILCVKSFSETSEISIFFFMLPSKITYFSITEVGTTLIDPCRTLNQDSQALISLD